MAAEIVKVFGIFNEGPSSSFPPMDDVYFGPGCHSLVVHSSSMPGSSNMNTLAKLCFEWITVNVLNLCRGTQDSDSSSNQLGFPKKIT